MRSAHLPVAKVELYERLRIAAARSAQFELGSLKRALKNKGYSEAVIHSIIPDHPSPAKKAEPTPPATGPTGPAGGGNP